MSKHSWGGEREWGGGLCVCVGGGGEGVEYKSVIHKNEVFGEPVWPSGKALGW